VPDVVEDGVTGMIVPEGDDAALASALSNLLSSPRLRQRMGANAAERSGRFSSERLVDDLDRLYRHLLEGRR
jgi:glycosyltransferase involved in cell wall biosynthesis